MANGSRTGDPRGINKGRSSKFREGYRVRQHLKKAGGYIGRNVVEITIKIKTIVRKPLMIKRKIIFDNFIKNVPKLNLYKFDQIVLKQSRSKGRNIHKSIIA